MRRRGALLCTFALLCLLAAGTRTLRAASAPDSEDDPVKSGTSGTSGSAPRRPEGYAIKLSRPMKAGQRYAWSADATVNNSIPAPGAATAVPETLSVHLDAVVQILSVDSGGDVTEMAATVNECTARTAKERKTVVQPGRTILVEAGKWKSKLTATSGNLTIQDYTYLAAVLSVPRLDETTDDDIFGSAKRQNVGDTWPLRPDQMARSWAAAGYKLKPQNISGSMKMKSAEMVDGVECVRIAGHAKIEHFLPPALDLPDGTDVGDATTEIKFTKLVPADPAKQVLQDSRSVTVHFTLKKDPRSITPEVHEGKLLRSVGVKLKQLPD